MIAPTALSRYRFCRAVREADDTISLFDREPYGYVELPDNRRHAVTEGDNLWSLAEIYFRGDFVENASELWWVIADFQPDPIVDPTVALEKGSVIFIPSNRTLHEEILSEKRRAELDVV